MKTIRVTLSISLHIDVPDDAAPGVLTSLVRDLVQGANNWNDGRYPYATELLQEGAQRLAHSVIDDKPWLANHPGWPAEGIAGSVIPICRAPYFWGDFVAAEWTELPDNWANMAPEEWNPMTLTPEEEAELNQLNALAYDLLRVTERAHDKVPPCWLVMSVEARDECRRQLFAHLRASYYRTASDEQIVTALSAIDLTDGIRRWRDAELSFKRARATNPRAYFAE